MSEIIGNRIETFQCVSDKKTMKAISKYWKPVLASIVAAIGSMAAGVALGYPSPSIPNINTHRNPFRVDPEQESWFGSLSFLTVGLGALLNGFVTDKLGRKLTLMVGALPTVVGWTIIAGANSMIFMYIGRAITGVGNGINLAIVDVYISEISPPEIRGQLMSFNELFMNAGVLLAYVLGTYIPWNWLAIACAAISTLQVTLLLLVPESPRWLLMSGQTQEAVSSLNWLRGEDETSNHEAEIATILESLKKASEIVPWLNYLRPPLLKCFFVSQFLFILMELSGVNVLRMYTVSIFEASGSSLNADMQTIAIGAVLTLGSTVFAVIVDYFERRTLLLISSVTVGVSMAALGTFFKIQEANEHISQEYLFWLPLLSMVVATIGFVFGIGPLSYVVVGELFSTRGRGRASSLGVVTLSLFGFLMTKCFVDVSFAVGIYGAFWICAVICILGTVVIYFMVPETKGEILENIQHNLGQ